MKSILIASAVIFSLVAVSSFGFAAISHGGMDCEPLSPDQPCPPTEAGMVAHHVTERAGGALAAIVPPAATSLLAAFFLAMHIGAAHWLPPPKASVSAYKKIFESDVGRRGPSELQRLRRWLSILVNSPSSIEGSLCYVNNDNQLLWKRTQSNTVCRRLSLSRPY